MFIGLPMRDDARPETKRMISGLQGRLGIVKGCPWVDIARTEIVELFLASGEAELLFVDADNWTDVETIAAMRTAGAAIITCTYRKRIPPHIWCMQPLEGKHPRLAPMRTVDGKRIIEIESDGMGCCLIQRHVIETMVAKHPELDYVADDGTARHWLFQPFIALDHTGVRRPAGDDRAFFLRARAAGFKVECLVDATVFHDGIEGRLADVFKDP
jgi:hypothetical protein